MSNQTLRDLAKDYAQGVLTQNQYRKTRRALIKDIVNGDVKVKSIDFLPPLNPAHVNEMTETERNARDKNKTQINYQPIPKSPPKTKQAKPRTRKKTPFMLISAVVVMILMIGIGIFFYPSPSSQKKVDIVASSTQTSTNTVAGEDLITEFLTAKNWRKERLDEFIIAWSALTEEERYAASKTKRMQRLHDAIYKQFLGEKALAQINSEQATLNQKKLITFAEAIGIDDPRLVLH